MTPNPHYEECRDAQRLLYIKTLWTVCAISFVTMLISTWAYGITEDGRLAIVSASLTIFCSFLAERACALMDSRRAQIVTVERGRRDDGINGVPPATTREWADNELGKVIQRKP